MKKISPKSQQQRVKIPTRGSVPPRESAQLTKRNSIPSAYTTVTRNAGPSNVGSGVQISHRELIQPIELAGGATGTIDAIINPRRSLFPWLKTIAMQYDLYRLDKLSIEYVPTCGTTTNGQIGMAIDYDANDTSPSDLVTLMMMTGAVHGQLYAPLRLPFNCGMQVGGASLKRKLAGDGDAVNASLADAGAVRIRVNCGGSAEETYSLGVLFVSYTVTFFNPCFDNSLLLEMYGTLGPSDTGAEYTGGTSIAPSATALVPFGIDPMYWRTILTAAQAATSFAVTGIIGGIKIYKVLKSMFWDTMPSLQQSCPNGLYYHRGADKVMRCIPHVSGMTLPTTYTGQYGGWTVVKTPGMTGVTSLVLQIDEAPTTPAIDMTWFLYYGGPINQVYVNTQWDMNHLDVDNRLSGTMIITFSWTNVTGGTKGEANFFFGITDDATGMPAWDYTMQSFKSVTGTPCLRLDCREGYLSVGFNPVPTLEHTDPELIRLMKRLRPVSHSNTSNSNTTTTASSAYLDSLRH